MCAAPGNKFTSTLVVMCSCEGGSGGRGRERREYLLHLELCCVCVCAHGGKERERKENGKGMTGDNEEVERRNGVYAATTLCTYTLLVDGEEKEARRMKEESV